jgi:3-hydroxyisobutyrate dehydrogenase
MATIAFLGTGLLGSGFVRALRRRGDDVQVWNRTAARAKLLEADGAKAFDDPAAAAKGASRVHLALSDDAAVDDVLERARPGFSPDVVVVDHTTTSVSGAIARVKRWQERKIAFWHAPVFMGPQNALEGTGLMLSSGDRALFDRLEPALGKMTGKVVYLGTQPERAAGVKLMGNLFLVSMMSGLFDMLGLAKALDIPQADAAALFDVFNPAAMLPARAKTVLKGEFDKPSWELAMARKDVRLMLAEAERGNVPLAIVPAIAKEMDRWLAKGHGKDDWSVIASDVIRPKA